MSSTTQLTVRLIGLAVILILAEPGWFLPSSLLRADSIQSLWEGARRDGEYRKTSAEELIEAEALFRRTLAGKEETASLREDWRKLNFDLLPVREQGADLLVLREAAEHKTGRGYYVFRRGPALAIALEAPHSTDDLHTGPIALRLFARGEAAAGAWNTVPRARGDLAHLSASWFQVFTRAFAETHKQGLFVQLHGFEMGKRLSEAGMDAEMILSNGTKQPPGWLLHLAQLFRAEFGEKVKVYPRDIRELGGTTNAQALMLQDMGRDRFAHVEMSLPFRKRLREEEKQQEAFLKAITTVFRKDRGEGR